MTCRMKFRTFILRYLRILLLKIFLIHTNYNLRYEMKKKNNIRITMTYLDEILEYIKFIYATRVVR